MPGRADGMAGIVSAKADRLGPLAGMPGRDSAEKLAICLPNFNFMMYN